MFFKKNKIVDSETKKDWDWFFKEAGSLGKTYQSVTVKNLTFTSGGYILADSSSKFGANGYIAKDCTPKEMYTIAEIIKRRGYND